MCVVPATHENPSGVLGSRKLGHFALELAILLTRFVPHPCSLLTCVENPPSGGIFLHVCGHQTLQGFGGQEEKADLLSRVCGHQTLQGFGYVCVPTQK